MRKFCYWYLKNLYSPSEISAMVKFSEENFDPTYTDNPALGVTKTSNVKIISWEKIKDHMYKSYQGAKHMNATEIAYDLYDMTDFQSVNYNIYESNVQASYDWHTDGTADEAPIDIKLTVIINVSTSTYTGGEFEIFRQGIIKVPEIDIPGSVIIFPSFWNHRVLPVTSGIRRSMSYWINGPKFR
jgi:PKHD-type hydroxylase